MKFPIALMLLSSLFALTGFLVFIWLCRRISKSTVGTKTKKILKATICLFLIAGFISLKINSMYVQGKFYVP